jgi:hypothetical protein
MMRLGAGAVHGFLLLFGTFVHDGAEVEIGGAYGVEFGHDRGEDAGV